MEVELKDARERDTTTAASLERAQARAKALDADVSRLTIQASNTEAQLSQANADKDRLTT